MKDNVAIIIPAYNPDEQLEKLIRDLKQQKYTKITIINDGSKDTQIFEKIKNDAENKLEIIHHKQNRGKGAALKTGIKKNIEKFPDIIGIITVDADGQHRIEDIDKIHNEFIKDKNTVILGVRDFEKKNIPLRSKIGNIFFSYKVKQKTGKKIKDTQTGLRAIPKKMIEEMLNIEGERYEYETNVLLNWIKKDIEIREVTIETIYIEKNRKSNYRPIKDSIEIFKTL